MARILLVDDAPAEFALGQSFLGRAGSFALVSGTDEEVLDRIRSLRPDVVLLEARRSEKSAIARCRAIKAEAAIARTPVVFLAAPSDASRCLAAGGDGVAARPLTVARPVELVRRFVPVQEREHERAALTARVRVLGDGHEGLGFTRDIGAGGLFLHTGETCARGDLVELAVRMPMRVNDEVHATGRVVRVVRIEGTSDSAGVTGVGIGFEQLSARDRIEIVRFVREHARGVA